VGAAGAGVRGRRRPGQRPALGSGLRLGVPERRMARRPARSGAPERRRRGRRSRALPARAPQTARPAPLHDLRHRHGPSRQSLRAQAVPGQRPGRNRAARLRERGQPPSFARRRDEAERDGAHRALRVGAVSETVGEVLSAESADGTRVGCELLGEGPPLLVVHGSIADRRRWRAVRDGLAAGFRLHLMDRRGRGLSAEEGPGEYALEREAEDIRALVSAIGGDVLVLAHSYGGTCSLEAAIEAPAIARMLVYEPAFAPAGDPVFPHAALAEVIAALDRGDRETAVLMFYRHALSLDEDAIAAVRASPLWQLRLEAAHTLGREAKAANA